jgi:hypothetical protein
MAEGKELLTHSRLACAKMCLRKYYGRYVCLLARQAEAKALRQGKAIHAGLAAWGEGKDEEEAISIGIAGYDETPEWANAYDWEVERQTVACLLAGYFARYARPVVLVVEQAFEIPLVNPETEHASRNWALAGKIDGVVRLSDGRLAIIEHKSASESIDPMSNYWARLRHDSQISIYFDAARTLGIEVEYVLYDVIRKPSIAPHKATPVENRKYKKDGELYANMRDTDETPEQYGDRLWEDIQSRPEFYYQQREIPRLSDDLEEHRSDIWQQAQTLNTCHLRGLWFRNVSRMTCPFCEFADLCLQGIKVNPDEIPNGFVRLDDPNPELSD